MTVYPPIIGTFQHGDTVTITIVKITDPANPVIIINGAGCTEIGSTGDFAYVPAIQKNNVDTYLFTMTNGLSTQDLKGTLDPAQPDAPTVEEIEAELAEEHGSGSWEKNSSGSETYTDTVLDENSDPIEGAKVIAYSDSDRTTVADMTLTDVNGVFVFHLDPGTYYMRAKKAEYRFDDWEKVISA
jgi:hypothetical protein